MKSVLIVEDDVIIADMLQEALEADGYRVTGNVRTVEQAMKATEQDRPDSAVIDIRLASGGLGTDVGTLLKATTNAVVMFSSGNSSLPGPYASEGDAIMTKPYKLRDVARGLAILFDIKQFGQSNAIFPAKFRLLEAALPLDGPSEVPLAG